MSKHKRKCIGGFTLVELLVVIVVIGLLSTIVLNTVSGSRHRARVARTESELGIINRAILTMVVDLSKWPNGCPVHVQSDPEVAVQLSSAGLTSLPPLGVVDTGCEWTSYDLNNWKGPYLADDEIIDAWENNYIFDPDYYPYQNCGSETTLAATSAIVSYGPDGNEYSCDDVYKEMKN